MVVRARNAGEYLRRDKFGYQNLRIIPHLVELTGRRRQEKMLNDPKHLGVGPAGGLRGLNEHNLVA